MTTSIYRLLAVGLVATSLLTSCAKLPKQSKYIPAEAAVVVDINTRQLIDKLMSGGLSLDKLSSATAQAENAGKNAEDTSSASKGGASKALAEIQNAGVDLSDHFFASYVQDSVDQSKSYVSMIATLLDSAKFSAFIKKAVPNATSGKGEDFAYIFIPENQTIIGWNADQAVSITGLDPMRFANAGAWAPGAMPPMSAAGGDAAASDSTTAAVPASPAAVSDDSLRHFWAGRLEHLFHLKDSERATSVKSFKALLGEHADFSLWCNSGALLKSQALQQIPGDLALLLKDSYSASLVNFENGKVVLSSSSYVSPALDSVFSKYKTTIDESMLKNYPSKNITMFFALGADLHALGDILTITHTYELADAGLQGAAGVSLADVLSALSGQLVAVGSDYAQVKKPSEYDPADSTTSTDMKWIVSAKIKDKAAFDRIMTSRMLAQVVTKEGDHYIPVIQSSKFFSTDITTEHLVLGSSTAFINQYLAGKSGAFPDEQLKTVKGQNAVYYTDFSRMLNELKKENLPDSNLNVMVGKAAGLFKDLSYTVSPLQDKAMKGEVVLNLQDQSKNALPQLVSFGLEMYGAFNRANKPYEREDVIVDSAATIVPTVDTPVTRDPLRPGQHKH